MNMIKVNEGIEGAEVRDATKWLKGILGTDINKMKIGRTGFLLSFVDPTHVIAGKVFIPSTTQLWHSEKEVGFNCERLFKAFSIFKRRDKTELYIKEDRLFLKNGALKWRYNMEGVELAQKIDFSQIPSPAIAMNLKDVLVLKSINKGKKASEKQKIVAFKYGGGKATMYVADGYGNNIITLAEINAEGPGEGVALYNLPLLEKLLKDAKAGFVRIEEGKPIKLNIRTGKKTRALLYLAPYPNEELREEIKGLNVPSSPVCVEEKKEEYKETTREEVVKGNISFLTVREATGAKFHSSADVYEDMKAEAKIDRECIWVLHLNNQNKVVRKELVAMGTGNASNAAGREIYRRAIIEGAMGIVMVHNHPGGDHKPSEADKEVCTRLRDAGKLIGIKLIDFMVIAADGYTSFADEGLLDVLRRDV